MMKTKPIHPTRMSRRRGQALLLAVLVMIFAALLGASFIAVVSLNLNQTARQSDRTAAVQAASAGIDYVNRQLTYSKDGRQWFKKTYVDSGLLTTFQAQPGYYTPLDRAQNWAGNFVKFPDPLAPGDNGPKFMVRVEKIDYNTNPSSGLPDADKPGSLKITVIGLSPDDDTAWSKLVAYKGGVDEAPLGQVMHTVSNWDFGSNKVPTGKIATYASPTITLNDVQGRFPTDGPFYITIGPGGSNTVRGALVSSATVTTTTTTLTLANPTAIVPAPTVNDHIELAAGAGIPTIDYDRDTTTAEVALPDNRLTDNGATAAYRGNGGLVWFGTTIADQLRPISQSYGATSLVPGFIRTSGVMTLNTGAGVTFQGSSMTAAGTLVNSGDTNFPSTEPGSSDVVEDGYNRIVGNDIAQNRTVSAFTPPVFSSGKSLERYRNLTKFSPPIASTDVTPNLTGTITDTSSLYGYGRGIYIDNYDDREQTFDGTVRRDLTRAELLNLWFDHTSTGTAYLREGTPANPDDTGNTNRSLFSLEDAHRRGWIAKDQFLPRGVLVELVKVGANYYLDVTRDGAQDNNADHPANSVDDSVLPKDPKDKHWREANGTDQVGIYHKRFNWPANGILFAEGNIRIRGAVVDPPSSLTVVSMNNIYIEGTTKIDSTSTTNPQKLLLMAKNNVVVNPTQVIGRPLNQSIATAGAVTLTKGTATTTPLTLADPAEFMQGDLVQVVSPGTNNTETVAGTLLLTSVPTVGGVVNAVVVDGDGSALTTPCVIRHYKDTPANAPYTLVDDVTSYGIQRRIRLATAAKNGYALDLAHGGRYQKALEITFKPGPDAGLPLPPTGGDQAFIGSKVVFNNLPIAPGTPGSTAVHTAPTIAADYKRITGEYNFNVTAPPPTAFDIFKDGLADQATAQAYTLTALKTEMDGITHSSATNSWAYLATPTLGYENIPFFYLAGLGNRHNWNYIATAPNATEWRTDIRASTTPAEIPLATSMKLMVNNDNDVITDLRNNGTMYFGFDPTFLGSTSTALGTATPEDVLTVDKYFYSPDSSPTFTLDTRKPRLAISPGTVPVSIRPPSGLVGITTTAPLPAYRLASLKVEDVIFDGTNLNVDPIDFDIHAYVYAEAGSWVILPAPAPALDPKLKGDEVKSYYNTNGNTTADPGEYLDLDGSSSYTDGDQADLNRDGVLQLEEKYWLQRYFRLNYQVNFTGSIMENLTLPVATEGTVPGLVQRWSDSMATATIDTSVSATPVIGRVKYNFDPDVARGLLDPTTGTPPVGFYLPETPDLVYQS